MVIHSEACISTVHDLLRKDNIFGHLFLIWAEPSFLLVLVISVVNAVASSPMAVKVNYPESRISSGSVGTNWALSSKDFALRFSSVIKTENVFLEFIVATFDGLAAIGKRTCVVGIEESTLCF